jgi:protein-disulfide isomerase
MMTVSELNQLIILMSSSQKTIRFIRIDFIQEFETGGLPSKGGQDAAVNIIAFIDYECPNCAQINLILQQVQNQYQDKVRLVFKNLPNNEVAFKSAAAALAAHKQNRYWEFHNRLFTDADKSSQARIDNIAAQIGLDRNKFAAEMQSPDIQDLIHRDIRDATEANISEVPAVFINGRRLNEHSLDGIQRMIDDEFMKKSQPKPSPTE